MRPDDLKEYSKFLAELRRESERGLALIGAAFIDDKLGATLAAFFACEASELLNGPNAPLGNFSSRIDTCFALGLIEQGEKDECHLIRRIRNTFAHRLMDASFSQNSIYDLCKNLKSPMPGDDTDHVARFRFENAVIAISIRLFYRPEYVAKEKREAKQWVDPATVGWRRTAEQMPPDGAFVIAYGSAIKK